MSSNIPTTTEEMLTAVFGSAQIDKDPDPENSLDKGDIADPVGAAFRKARGEELPTIRDLKNANMRPVVVPHRPDLSDAEPVTVEQFFGGVRHNLTEQFFPSQKAAVTKAAPADEGWDAPLNLLDQVGDDQVKAIYRKFFKTALDRFQPASQTLAAWLKDKPAPRIEKILREVAAEFQEAA